MLEVGDYAWEDDRAHSAVSILVTVELLYKARRRIAVLERRLANVEPNHG